MTELKIDGMSCDHCVKRVRGVLEKHGAEVADVRVGSARVRASEQALPAALAALAKAGYPASTSGSSSAP